MALLLALNLANATLPHSTVATLVCDFSISGFITPCTATPPNGAVDLTVTPTSTYTFAWSNGAFTEDITDLPAGTYTVTVTDTDGCTATASYDVPALNPGPLFVTGTAYADTCGMGLGSIDLVVWAGNPPFVFNWSNGSQSIDLTGLTGPNGFTVTVTDALGAVQILDFFVANYTGYFNNPISNYYTLDADDNTNCISPPNGGIAYTPLTSVPFIWAWSNGVNSPNNPNLDAGIYTATVTLGNCTQNWTPSVTILDTPYNPVLAMAPINPLCGEPNGSIGLTVTTGAAPFTYSWDNGASTEDLANLPAGDYAVTVTGTNGCTATANTNLDNLDISINVTGTATANTSCNSPNGSVSTSVSPTPPPAGLSYSYDWSNGPHTPNISGLISDNYTVTVTLGSTCTSVKVFFVENNTQAPTLSVSTTNQSCQALGSVDLSVSGGTGPFGYAWSNGATTEDLPSVPAGNYTVTVSAAGGCSASISTTVQNTSGPVDTTFINGTTCDTADVGTTTVVLTGSNGCDSTVITTLTLAPTDTTLLTSITCDASQAGVFEQSLTNQFGCDSLIFTTVNYVGSDTTHLTGTSCNASEAGVFEQNLTNQFGCDSIVITTVTLLASDTLYIYGNTCDGSQAGVFEETLTNSNGCDSLIITTISYQAPDTTTVFDTSCDLGQTGVFQQHIAGANGCDSLVIITTITYSAADTTALFATTCEQGNAGVFEQFLTNANGCDSVVITTVSYVGVDTTFLFDTSCNPGNVGVFTETLTSQGGCDSIVVLTVAYSASDTTLLASTTCDPSQVGTIVETLTSTDGCDSVIVSTVSFMPLPVTAIKTTTCNIAEMGVFIQTFSSWQGCDSSVIHTVVLLPSSSSSVSATTCDASQAGVFTQVLTNWLGCDSTVTTTVAYSPILSTNLTSTTCDPTQAGVFTQTLSSWLGCDSIVTTTVTLLPSSTTSLTATTCNASEAGVFTETFTGWQGCDSVVTTTVTYIDPPNITAAFSDFSGYNISCAGATDGWIAVTATGGAGPFNYVWDNGTTTPIIGDLAAGFYFLTVTDANGCEHNAGFFTLIQPDALDLTLDANDPNCADPLSGNIEVSIEGGVSPYLFAIDGNWQGSNLFEGLVPDTYEVTATDANGCFVTQSAVIDPQVPLTVDLGGNFNITEGESTVLEAVVNVPIGTLVDVDWSDNIVNATCPECLEQAVSPTESTFYTVTVENIYGCTATDEIKVGVIENGEQNNVYVPSAFSPNRDGINDYLTVFANPAKVNRINRFVVLDNWGDVMFEYYNFPPNEAAFSWDGMHRGDLMRPAVFKWFVEVEFSNGETKRYDGTTALVK